MKLPAWILALCLVTGLTALSPATAQSLSCPAPGRGAGAKTLVVYAATRQAFSLADDLAALKMELRRVATTVTAVPVTAADPNQMLAADYLVIFCPQPLPRLPAPLLQAVAARTNAVLWVGYGAEELGRLPEFKGQFLVTPYAAGQPAKQIHYRGRDWAEPLATWLPAQVPAPNATIIMTVTEPAAGQTNSHPLCWTLGAVTFFAGLPTQTENCALFSDKLLDFYGVTTVTAAAVCLRIDGYHCRQDHQEFRHMVDYLAQRGHPFVVGVIPAYWDPEEHKLLEMDSQPEFVAALRYAQQHGGRLILEGYRAARQNRPGTEPEFWDAVADRPLTNDTPQRVQDRVYRGVREMWWRGLFPLAWETPQYAAAQADYAEFASCFSTAFERMQLSDATALATFAGTAPARDEFGRLVVPENLGVVTGQRESLVRLYHRAEVLTRLRGTIASCSFPAYLSEGRLIQTVKLLEQMKVPFLDLAEGDHLVCLPEAVFLTGAAEFPTTWQNDQGTIGWQAFDRAGKLIAEDAAPESKSGNRILKRRGDGDYEVFHLNKAQP
ncbi:MAG TPA: DUF2334 domain-containing protein [Dongiaceae bacterium]|nr:DUF2334 domain-containing protein [Dongiaceae bacterium]